MNISSVVKNKLCVSCGLCAGVCPKKCIASAFKSGSYLPTVDENTCVNCGHCHKVCPGKSDDYVTGYTGENIFFGRARTCLAAQVKDKTLLSQSTSGGIVTALTKNLLRDGLFDAAFLVDTYNHGEETFTRLYEPESDFADVPKSRYVTVNHSRAVRHMLEKPDAKLILVGTSCFIRGILNVIARFKLNRDNYFLAGLFCDKTMTYNVWRYFRQFVAADKLYFRTKEPDGWPGDVGLEQQGRKFFLHRRLRMQVKDFFCVERCLYCLDKLNRFADISFGDNYSDAPLPAQMNRREGTSTLIVRTERGARVFDRYRDEFFTRELSPEEIFKSQHLDARIKNFVFGEYKSAQVGYPINVVPPEISFGVRENPNLRREYESLLVKQQMGRENFFPNVAADIWRTIIS